MSPTILPSERFQYQTYANHKQIVAIKASHKPRGNRLNLNQNKQVKISNKTNGRFSGDSQKRLKEVIYNWAATIFILKETTDFKKKHKNIAKYLNFSFITLTLPQTQMHSDLEIKAILNRYLGQLIRIAGYKINYTWRAETQEKGNIHFHILMDHYFPIWILQPLWNDCLAKAGYMSGLEFINPHTVNCQFVKSLKHVWSYLHKYCSKGSYKNRRGVEGHQWGSSDNIKKFEGKKHMPMTDDEWFGIITKSIQNECKILYVNDIVTIIYLIKNSLSHIIGKPRALEWLQTIKDNFDLILPILMNYKYLTKFTEYDYELKHSWKINYLKHSDDTDMSKHYEKYDEIVIMDKMKQKNNYH